MGDPPEIQVASGRTERAAWAAEAAVTGTVLEDPGGVCWLLGSLRKIGAPKLIAELLGRNPAGSVALDRKGDLAVLLYELNEIGADDQITTLLARDLGRAAALDGELITDRDRNDVTSLLRRLRDAGAADQVAVLDKRLPGIGAFEVFVDEVAEPERYRYGREPTGEPATPWDWSDLP